jgi:C-terminal processing protease CtpA/Prc
VLVAVLLRICGMKKLIALFTIIVLGLSSLCAQNKRQINKLAVFAKVWGFLKYYHPDVAKGNPDWDKELVQMIPIIEAGQTDVAFNKTLIDWYSALPKAKLSPIITQLKSDTIMRVFDEQGIIRFKIPESLRKEFTKLYLYHLPDSNKFIDNHYKGIRFDYIYHIEDPMQAPAYPDEAHRLLALFRYWNIINYFYPHKKTNAAHWDDVLISFIPRFIAAANTNDYRSAFLMLTAELKDSHSFYKQPEWNKAHNMLNTPFTTYYIDGKYFIGDSRYDLLIKQQDFKIGDEIISVNNQAISDRVTDLMPFTTGTNQLSMYRNIAGSLFKIDTSRTIPIIIKRQGKLIEKIIKLYTWPELNQYSKDHPLKLWENMGNNIWYVRICEIENPDTLKKLFADIQEAKSVIWDLRSYPKFKVTQEISSGLFEHESETTAYYNGMLFFPGAFARHRGMAYDKLTTLKLPLYKGKMIVLVNEQTQSLAESAAYELRFRPNTIIMGQQTAGTTGNILFVDYPGGIEASYTAVKTIGLNNSFNEGQGVKIDKKIKLSGDKLLKYPDYMLQMAYEEGLKGL